jgi:hypothetical protein
VEQSGIFNWKGLAICSFIFMLFSSLQTELLFQVILWLDWALLVQFISGAGLCYFGYENMKVNQGNLAIITDKTKTAKEYDEVYRRFIQLEANYARVCILRVRHHPATPGVSRLISAQNLFITLFYLQVREVRNSNYLDDLKHLPNNLDDFVYLKIIYKNFNTFCQSYRSFFNSYLLRLTNEELCEYINRLVSEDPDKVFKEALGYAKSKSKNEKSKFSPS